MNGIFRRVNCCQTSVGEETLYQRLRTLEPVPEEWEAWLDALKKNPDTRLEYQHLLWQLGKEHYNGLVSFLWGDTMIKEIPMPYIILLRALPILSIVSMIFTGYLGLILLIFSAVINLGISVWFQHKAESHLSAIRYLSRMLRCVSILMKTPFPGLESLMERIQKEYKPFRHLRSRMSSVSDKAVQSSSMEGMAVLAKMIVLSDVYNYSRCAATLRKEREGAFRLYRTLGELDMLICTASFRKSLLTYCLPEFTEKMELDMDWVIHPMLSYPVPNTLKIAKSSLITGSNASGKSTFLKTVAVNAVLGQTLNTCGAKQFKLPRALVISSMALKDNLTGGDSYFVAEIKSFKRIMEATKETPCLCFVDEILRGTNTIERIAASAAVLYSLNQGSCLCLVASHDIELTRILKQQYDNYHFSEQVTEKGVSFDYTIKQGPSNTRNAILLLYTMGFEDDVITQANRLVEAFESDQSWPAFTQENA